MACSGMLHKALRFSHQVCCKAADFLASSLSLKVGKLALRSSPISAIGVSCYIGNRGQVRANELKLRQWNQEGLFFENSSTRPVASPLGKFIKPLLIVRSSRS